MSVVLLVRRLASMALVVVIFLLAPAGARAATTFGAWGDNSGGELGDGSFVQSDSPVGVQGVSGVKALAAGNRFNLALLDGGHVIAWGENQFGQLGSGTVVDRTTPGPVKGLSGVVAVAAGGGHSLALLSNGTVMAWGYNAFGQLGDGTTTDRSTPVPVTGLSGVKAIAAGSIDSLALLSNGRVMAWGDNRDGQLGDGQVGVNSSVPAAVTGLSGVKAIAAGGLFNVALLSAGTAKAWGQGDAGQLGNGPTTGSDVPVTVSGLSGAVAVATGYDHALALLKNGTAVAWGDNTYGQLGVPGAGQNSDVPVAIPGLKGVAALAGGGESSYALLSTGRLESWGDNAVGQLGSGTTNFSGTPTPVPNLAGVSLLAAGTSHALALTTSVVAQPPPAQTSPWRQVHTPNPSAPPPPAAFDAYFTGVSAASASDAWAVGSTQKGLTQVAVAAHWDGHSWRAFPVPQPGGGRTAIFSGVLDVAPGNAWAVGNTIVTSTNSEERTLIEHWNGKVWSVVPSPNPFGGVSGSDGLNAIAGVSGKDMWAAGDDFDTNNNAIFLLFEHFNGTKWTAAPSPPSTGFDFANGLTTISSNDAWAVGTNASQTTLAAHWDGTRWTIVPTPSLQDGPAPTNELTAVSAVASNNVWASGYEDNVNQLNFRKPYFLHWNGSKWTLLLAPNAGGEGSLLRGIAALSAKDIWAVGQTQQNDGTILTLTEQFNGTNWNIVPSPDPGEVGSIVANSLDAVTSPGGGVVWALGAQEKLGFCCQQTLAFENTTG